MLQWVAVWVLTQVAWLRNHRIEGKALVFVVLSPITDTYPNSLIRSMSFWPNVVLINGPTWSHSVGVWNPTWPNVVRASIEFAQLHEYAHSTKWESIAILTSDAGEMEVLDILSGSVSAVVLNKEYVILPRRVVEAVDTTKCRHVTDRDGVMECLLAHSQYTKW